jgi:HEAT repeat protein
MHQDYPKPVRELLSYGDPMEHCNPGDPHGWTNYVKEFNLSLDDVPHLIRMLNDPTIKHTASGDPQSWADVHVWGALGQLGAADAIPDLIRCLDYDDENEVSDWTMEEIPMVLGSIGNPAIEPLVHYLEDGTKGCWNLAAAADGLVSIPL